MAYMRLSNHQYPLTQADIESAHPNVMFPAVFKAAGYVWVHTCPPPELSSLQNAIEIKPVFTKKGHWQQAWQIVDRFFDTQEATKEEQEMVVLEEEAVLEDNVRTAQRNRENLMAIALLEGLQTQTYDQIDDYIDTHISNAASIKPLLKVLTKLAMRSLKDRPID